MESIKPNTKQIIIQGSEVVILQREIERIFIRINGDSSYKLSEMRKSLPAVVELYGLIKQ
jgi:hypothetical protein